MSFGELNSLYMSVKDAELKTDRGADRKEAVKRPGNTARRAVRGTKDHRVKCFSN